MSGTRPAPGMRDVVAATVCSVALVAMLVLSSIDPRFAVICSALVILVIAGLWFGAERTGTVVVLLAMFTAPMTTLRPTAAVPFITVSDLLLGLGFLLLLPRLTRSRPRLPNGFVIGAWLLVATSLLPAAFSSAPGDNLFYLARLVAAVVLLPLAFGYWHPDLATLRRLAWTYVAGNAFGWVVGFLTDTSAGRREQGLTTHPNFLALTGQIAVTLLIFLYVTSPPARRWLVWVSGIVSVGIVLSSGSRAGLVAVAFTALVYPLVNRSIRAAYFTISAGVVTTFLLGRIIDSSGEGSAVVRLFVGDKSTSGSDLQRENALSAGWSDFLSHPLLGGGFTEKTLETHNLYLEVAQGAGIVGLVGFLLLLWSAVRTVLSGGPLASLGYTALGYALVGLLSPSLWDRLVWTAVALSFVASTRYESDDGVETPVEDSATPARASRRAPSPIGSERS